MYLKAWINLLSDFAYSFCDLSKNRYKWSDYGISSFLKDRTQEVLHFLWAYINLHLRV